MSTDRRNVSSEDQHAAVLAKIKEYEAHGFSEASKIHKLIMTANPGLHARLWYGMPGYAASKDSAVLCFFRKDTLISFGITEAAQLDETSSLIPSAWYIRELNEEVTNKITEVVRSVTIHATNNE
jgi:hypothetical protein